MGHPLKDKTMKLLSVIAFLTLSLGAAIGQVNPSTPYSANWPVATATGVVGGAGYYLNFDNLAGGGPPYSYTIDVYVTGTLPSVCTFEVQSSPDGTGWNSAATSLSGDVSCAATSSTMATYSFISKPDSDIRINIGTLTGADGTTQIRFFWRRASNVK